MVQVKRPRPSETRLKGVPLSPGVAIGRPCYYVRQSNRSVVKTVTDPHHECERLHTALRWLAQQRSLLARETTIRLGKQHAEIFEAHRLMLTDGIFQSQLVQAIEEKGYSAEEAVEKELDLYKQQLSAADSEYLQQRVADVSEVQLGLLGHLRRVVACRRCQAGLDCRLGHCRLGNGHILIGEEITASLPIETDQHTLGFIVDKAGPTSHAVILARALRRPVIGNIQNLRTVIPADASILVDGNSGEVILNPSDETLAHYQAALAHGRQGLKASAPIEGLAVMANIGRSGDVGDALAAGAEGVGLYRTEMELLVAGRLLGEDEQAARYSEVVKAMSGRPVCIRLLDLGYDKTAEWLETALPGIPRSGQRGARLLLACPELLRTQARALARAGVHGPIHVLYPMIVSVEQFAALRSLFAAAVADMQPVDLQHGVLFEVPAACLAAEQIMQVADFGCIGTNDLIQYLYGTDRRRSDAGAKTGFESDSALWTLIKTLARAARQAAKPMAICGEIAGNPALTARIIAAGITAISTSPAQIAEVRRAAQEKVEVQPVSTKSPA